MGANRIVRRYLQKSGDVRRMYHKRKMGEFWKYGQKMMRRLTAWIDDRPRDEKGNLVKL